MVYNLDREKEKSLIVRLKDEDASAFDELVFTYQRKGFSIAYNLAGNCEDAKDILQEAFIKVYCNIKSFNEDASFFTWLYRIVVNCALDFMRKRKRIFSIFREPVSEEEFIKEPVDMSSGPQERAINDELSQRLEACIAQLPEKQKACFLLKHRSGLKNQEIAEVLGCKLSTVKVHLFRAANTLQSKVSLEMFNNRRLL